MRSFVAYLLRTAIVNAAVLILIIRCSTKTADDFCTHGYGKTILQGRILDFYTKKPIDSVKIDIVWNSSWDPYLDTLVKQNDESFSFIFNLENDCEPYFVTLSNNRYWTDFDPYPAYKASIVKGAINNFEFNLKPATFLKMNVKRDTLDRTSDVIILEMRKISTKDWRGLDGISVGDFTYLRPGLSKNPADDIGNTYEFSDSGSYRTISMYHKIESMGSYEVRWTRSNTVHSDTLYYHFTAKPFDTVNLDYNFRKY